MFSKNICQLKFWGFSNDFQKAISLPSLFANRTGNLMQRPEDAMLLVRLVVPDALESKNPSGAATTASTSRDHMVPSIKPGPSL